MNKGLLDIAEFFNNSEHWRTFDLNNPSFSNYFGKIRNSGPSIEITKWAFNMIPFAWWDKYRAVIRNFRSKKMNSVNRTVLHPEMCNRWDPTSWMYVRPKWPNGVQALNHGLETTPDIK